MNAARRAQAALLRRMNPLAVLLAFWLLVCSAFELYPRTAYGTQCPTAPVQTVVVSIRDCCGRQVAQVRRAPKPGEAAFVQCQCAEKKAAQHGPAVPPRLEPFVWTVFRFDVPPVIIVPAEKSPYVARPASLSVPPRVRPPSVA